MKIITWNCNMAFRKKAEFILIHKPDILIVPECECPDKLLFNENIPKPTDMLWFGTNQNKGLGIFSYSDSRFKLLDTHNPEFKMIIPIAVTGGQYDFTLYAIWANNPGDPDGHYIEQVWKAIKHYDMNLTNKKTMLVGDFNSNTIWDRNIEKVITQMLFNTWKEKEYSVATISTTNSRRAKKPILRYTCIDTRTNLITLIIALYRQTWRKGFSLLK
jgi:exonuclease III